MTTAIDIFINMMYDYWYTSFFFIVYALSISEHCLFPMFSDVAS